MNKLIAAVVAGLVLVGVVVGVSRSDDASIRSAANEATAGAKSTDERTGSEEQRSLPEFEGKLFGGGTLASSDIKGPAVIHVHASWCPACQNEAPAFAQVQREHPDLNYYYIAVEDDERAASSFTKEHGWKSAPTIDDSAREVEGAFGLSGQPHSVFISKDGEMTVHQGPGSFDDLDELAERIA